MEPYASFPSLCQSRFFCFPRRERGSEEDRLGLDKSVHDTVREIGAELGRLLLPLSQTMEISIGIEMASPGALGWWEKVR